MVRIVVHFFRSCHKFCGIMGSVIDSVYFLVSHFYKHVSYSNACKYYWLHFYSTVYLHWCSAKNPQILDILYAIYYCVIFKHFAYVLSMSKHGAYIFLIFLCVKKLLHLFWCKKYIKTYFLSSFLKKRNLQKNIWFQTDFFKCITKNIE